MEVVFISYHYLLIATVTERIRTGDNEWHLREIGTVLQEEREDLQTLLNLKNQVGQ